MAKSRHRRKPPTRSTRSAGKHKALAGLETAHDLMDEGEFAQARLVLEELRRQHPHHLDALNNLAYVCYQMGDLSAYLRHCIELGQRQPDDPQARLVLASAYSMNVRPALALRTYRRFLERWPEHAEAEKVRGDVVSLETGVLEMIAEANFTGAEGLRSAEMHEELQVLLQEGNYEAGRALALQLIEEHPHFAPAYNNLSQLYFLHGKLAEALATARQVLDFAPDNFQAVANLARMLYLNGNEEEAARLADKLKTLQSENPDLWVKQAETFSFFGADEAVLAAYRGAKQAGVLEKPLAPGLLCHLAAVASLRLGREKEARALWKQALQLMPGFELAAENLADLNKPVGERHGPWAYNLGYWLPRRRADELAAHVGKGKKDQAALTQAVRQFLQEHADITYLAPILLARSDPHAAGFVLSIADAAQTPELLEAVKSFALGQRGADSLRLRAATIALQHGLLEAGALKLWVQGAWSDILLVNTEITGEADEWHVPAKAKRLAEKGFFELRDGDPEVAERLFNEALQLVPGDPRLLNNLAQAYKMQGRNDEHHQIVQQIYEQHPDYFFGIIWAAMRHVERNELDKAQQLLTPLLQRKKLHVSEMAALCGVQIELYLKQGKRDMARSCFNILEQVYPDHPNVEVFRARLQKPDFSKLLRKPFGWR